jgi:hypothetical protein
VAKTKIPAAILCCQMPKQTLAVTIFAASPIRKRGCLPVSSSAESAFLISYFCTAILACAGSEFFRVVAVHVVLQKGILLKMLASSADISIPHKPHRSTTCRAGLQLVSFLLSTSVNHERANGHSAPDYCNAATVIPPGTFRGYNGVAAFTFSPLECN